MKTVSEYDQFCNNQELEGNHSSLHVTIMSRYVKTYFHYLSLKLIIINLYCVFSGFYCNLCSFGCCFG